MRLFEAVQPNLRVWRMLQNWHGWLVSWLSWHKLHILHGARVCGCSCLNIFSVVTRVVLGDVPRRVTSNGTHWPQSTPHCRIHVVLMRKGESMMMSFTCTWHRRRDCHSCQVIHLQSKKTLTENWSKLKLEGEMEGLQFELTSIKSHPGSRKGGWWSDVNISLQCSWHVGIRTEGSSEVWGEGWLQHYNQRIPIINQSKKLLGICHFSPWMNNCVRHLLKTL